MTEIADLRLRELLRNARSRGASDVHFGESGAAALRVDGRLFVLDETPVDRAAVRRFIDAALPASAARRLHESGSADCASSDENGAPYRVHVYRHQDGLRVVVRLLSVTVPDLDALGLPPAVADLTERRAGLILFTGPTGSGKTTALAALVHRINRCREAHIVTVEDPIEYVHRPLRSLFTQVEVGRDVDSYAEALRAALRSDPDVIVVGEMRDRATIAAVLGAAETGHVVFATLHTNDAPQAVDRIVDAFDGGAQAQIRAQLAAVLAAVIALRLVPRRGGRGRRAAAEVLLATDAVRSMIRDGKTHQLRNAIVTGRNAGMHTLESHLSDLVNRGDVAFEAARAATQRPDDVVALESAAAS